MADSNKKPKLARLQCQVRRSTLDALRTQAELEVVTIGVVVRRVLDAHVATREAELARDGGV